MSKVAVQKQIGKTYHTKKECAEIAQSLGAVNVRESTIHNAAYRTRKLARPKIIGGVAYWTREDIETWLANS